MAYCLYDEVLWNNCEHRKYESRNPRRHSSRGCSFRSPGRSCPHNHQACIQPRQWTTCRNGMTGDNYRERWCHRPRGDCIYTPYPAHYNRRETRQEAVPRNLAELVQQIQPFLEGTARQEQPYCDYIPETLCLFNDRACPFFGTNTFGSCSCQSFQVCPRTGGRRSYDPPCQEALRQEEKISCEFLYQVNTRGDWRCGNRQGPCEEYSPERACRRKMKL
jgi:hypothetical protein